jgi:Flp pilus assembly protein TadD
MLREMKISGLTVTLLAGALGCAGTQRIGQTSGTEAQDDLPTTSASVTNAVDPLAAGGAKPTKLSDKRNISDEVRKDFDAALDKWDKARREGNVAGECSSVAGDFKDIADDHPDIIEARGNQAAVLHECGRDAEAQKIWEQLASQNYAPALAQMGYIAWKGGDAGRAETLFNRAIEADKNIGSVAARLNLAQILRERAARTSNPSEREQLRAQVQTHLRTVLAVDGNNLMAYANFCYLYYDLHYDELARLVGDQAVMRAEEIATGKFIGAQVETAGDEGVGLSAKERAKRAKDRDKTPAPGRVAVDGKGTGYTPEMKKSLGMVHNTLGLVWLRRKDVSKAIVHFKRAVEQDPTLNEARMNLAALSLNYRDYPTAEENFRAVLKSQPNNYEAAIGLGVALRGNRKFDEAEQQYLTAQKLNPQGADSYFNLGLLYQEYKTMDKATLQKAQQFYRDFLGRNATAQKRREAEKRIKDIDDTMAALEEAAKMQKEAEEMQRKQEQQQKEMEEQMKKMQEQEKQQPPATQPPAAAPAAPGPAAGGAAAPAAAANK